MEDRSEEAGRRFAELVRVMTRLRAPGGCPWDRKQTFETIKSYLLEEAYEVMDAIDLEDWPGLRAELGDLLLQPVFFAEMAREQGFFDIADSLQAINEKLVRRHPHVFADAKAETAEDVKVHWNAIKEQEKAEAAASRSRSSSLDDVPRSLPALMEAEKISKKAADFGFEWPEIDGVIAKLREEVAELAEARQTGDNSHVRHEIGDLLFTLVNIARFLKVDPEQALRETNGRFRRRFAFVEREAGPEASLDQMEELWQRAKQLELT